MNLLPRICMMLVLLCAFTTVLADGTAQDATCGVLVQQAMTEVETVCSTTGRNQACYGYISLEATPRKDITNFSFTRQGDLANVADLESVRLDPLDAENETWGIVLMKLQASLPDALPGQNVTFLLFGDVEIRNAVDSAAEPTLQPMQAFYFSTGITQTGCNEAPADGILIQTPDGVGKVNMRANGVDIQLGSTAFFQAQPDESLTISVLEGESVVRSDGKTVLVPDGAAIDVPLDEDLQADGEPGGPRAYDLDFLDDLPIDALPEDFIIDEPASEDELLDAEFESEFMDELDDEDELADIDPFSDESEFEDEESLGDDEFGDEGEFEDEESLGDDEFGDEGDFEEGDPSGGDEGDEGGEGE